MSYPTNNGKLSRSARKHIWRQRARLLQKIRRYNYRLSVSGIIRGDDDWTSMDSELLRLCNIIYEDRVARQGDNELPF